MMVSAMSGAINLLLYGRGQNVHCNDYLLWKWSGLAQGVRRLRYFPFFGAIHLISCLYLFDLLY